MPGDRRRAAGDGKPERGAAMDAAGQAAGSACLFFDGRFLYRKNQGRGKKVRKTPEKRCDCALKSNNIFIKHERQFVHRMLKMYNATRKIYQYC